MVKFIATSCVLLAFIGAALSLKCYDTPLTDPTQPPTLKECASDVTKCAKTTAKVGSNSFTLHQCGLAPYSALPDGCQSPPGIDGELCLCSTDGCNKGGYSAAGIEKPAFVLMALTAAALYIA